ncbi:right-handed parallel beta-helix repeat-containing protein [Micromonospora craniellae]|uniref:Right-handed parallel beta-helix repeat-containing protein n=1 Tax=Micromonospora craniellae TaxID=2294034 RepID=A0A372FSS9_9ACTN|nr:right-handed parallel beta-helix repeat-containing protein [Micromonospora craniellae]QOC91241.1 right-handed parallel beta-helix repeat-containing protein [Micromonospora craniellae]RFS43852.1 right-handed parallel beta-helix repeat-containing protein [Micromonospora craniellae]
MSDDELTSYGGPPPVPPGRRRRKIWVAAGVAGLTGVVGLAALGGVAARDQKSGDRHNTSDAQPAAAPTPDAPGPTAEAGGRTNHKATRSGAEQGADRKGREASSGEQRRDDKERGREVPCDSDKLIQAIEYANDNRGGTLELAKGCTYELTRSDVGDGTGRNGLPVITQAVTLAGRDTTIVRAPNAEAFRILNVGRSGHLTLKNVVVKGGLTEADPIAAARAKVDLSAKVVAKPTKAGAGTNAKAATPTKAPAAKAATKVPAATSASAAEAARGAGGDATLVHVAPGDGAGLLVQRGGRADVEHSEFLLHHAGGNGGAIANFGTARVAYSRVATSSAGGVGGGVFNAGVFRLEESSITDNSAVAGGGIGNGVPGLGLPGAGGTLWVWKSTIEHNRATDNAGGVLTYRGTATLTQSRVVGNHSGEDGGGLLALGDGQLALEKVLVARNSADDTSGGLGVGLESTAVIAHSEITENVAERNGGGLATYGGTAVVRDTAIVANRVVGQNSVAGGIYNEGGQVRLERSTVQANFSVLPPGGIYTTNDGVRIDRSSAVTANRPTNCSGSPVVPERCFG